MKCNRCDKRATCSISDRHGFVFLCDAHGLERLQSRQSICRPLTTMAHATYPMLDAEIAQ